MSQRLIYDLCRRLRPHLGQRLLLVATLETTDKDGRTVAPHLHGVLFCREHQIDIIKRLMRKFSSLPSRSRARAVDMPRLKSAEDALRWTAYWTKARGKLHRTQDMTEAGRIMWKNKRLRGQW